VISYLNQRASYKIVKKRLRWVSILQFDTAEDI